MRASKIRNIFTLTGFAALCVCLATAPALAETAEGALAAESSDRPELGAYRYRLEVTWEDFQSPPVEWNLLVEQLQCPCICGNETPPFAFADSAGAAAGAGECIIDYTGQLICDLPSNKLSGATEYVSYTPMPAQHCELTLSGFAVFDFYTDWEPGPEGNYENILEIDQGDNVVPAWVKGTMPLCSCGPTATRNTSWGKVKKNYR